MTEFVQGPTINELRAAYAEDAHRPGGVLHEIAKAAITQEVELQPKDVADIILPPKQPGDKYDARWELIEGAAAAIKDAAGLKAEEVLRYAELLNLRKPESIDESDIQRIDPQRALWMIEGGANRTSVVRRALILEAMQKVYGEQAGEATVYQFGSERPIPKKRADPKTQEVKPNAEYAVALEIAGEHLPLDEDTKQPKEVITEFELNMASALQAGYELRADSQHPVIPFIDRYVRLEKSGQPELVLVQPKSQEGGLVAGFEAVRNLAQLEADFQPVIATNGQYRAKDELQAAQWASKNDLNILSPLALGDEPGYKVNHAGKEIVTAERAPMAYVNEIAILHRLNP